MSDLGDAVLVNEHDFKLMSINDKIMGMNDQGIMGMKKQELMAIIINGHKKDSKKFMGMKISFAQMPGMENSWALK